LESLHESELRRIDRPLEDSTSVLPEEVFKFRASLHEFARKTDLMLSTKKLVEKLVRSFLDILDVEFVPEMKGFLIQWT
jgi:hypothetical protein